MKRDSLWEHYRKASTSAPLNNDTKVTVTLTSFYYSAIIIQSSLSRQVQILWLAEHLE